MIQYSLTEMNDAYLLKDRNSWPFLPLSKNPRKLESLANENRKKKCIKQEGLYVRWLFVGWGL